MVERRPIVSKQGEYKCPQAGQKEQQQHGAPPDHEVHNGMLLHHLRTQPLSQEVLLRLRGQVAARKLYDLRGASAVAPYGKDVVDDGTYQRRSRAEAAVAEGRVLVGRNDHGAERHARLRSRRPLPLARRRQRQELPVRPGRQCQGPPDFFVLIAGGRAIIAVGTQLAEPPLQPEDLSGKPHEFQLPLAAGGLRLLQLRPDGILLRSLHGGEGQHGRPPT
mmetsp:Transcript_106183/g.310384  ORF Transcript_106183/g.310384 Transcript_106183/m.310384 type:complete len:220 (+) Transcript_106183:1941-2600(+)